MISSNSFDKMSHLTLNDYKNLEERIKAYQKELYKSNIRAQGSNKGLFTIIKEEIK